MPVPVSVSSDPDQWIEHVRKCKHLPERQMKLLCSRVRDLLLEESNVHLVRSPVTVCGDIHGQFWDVIEIFRQGGEVPDTSYIFMVSAVSAIKWACFLCDRELSDMLQAWPLAQAVQASCVRGMLTR
jgi:hypothetical protein